MSVAQSLTDAFNRQDIDAVLECFTEDATYNDMFYGAHTGLPALRKLFERMWLEGTAYNWNPTSVAGTPDVELMEWTFDYTVSDALPRTAGRRPIFPGTSVLELSNGRCRVYREYFDRGAVLIQLGLPADPLYRILSRQT